MPLLHAEVIKPQSQFHSDFARTRQRLYTRAHFFKGGLIKARLRKKSVYSGTNPLFNRHLLFIYNKKAIDIQRKLYRRKQKMTQYPLNLLKLRVNILPEQS